MGVTGQLNKRFTRKSRLTKMLQKKDLLHLTIIIWIFLFFITLFTTYTVVILFIPKIRVHTSDAIYKESPFHLDWLSNPSNSSISHKGWGHLGANDSVLDIWDIAHFAKVNSPEEYSAIQSRIKASLSSSNSDKTLRFHQIRGKVDDKIQELGSGTTNTIYQAPDLQQLSTQDIELECQGRLYPDNFNVTDLSKLSTAIPYLKNYANPCFCDDKGSMACLPLFYVLGAEQCASDVSKMLEVHPLIHTLQQADWWHRKRLSTHNNRSLTTLRQYIESYKRDSQHIQHSVTRDDSSHPGILGDSSPSMFYDQLLWKSIPTNQQASEPEVTTADVLHSVVPQAKLIVVLCNPSEHLYYQWLYNSGSVSNDTQLWYELNQSLQIFRNCLSDMDIPYRDCLYSDLIHRDNPSSKVSAWNTLDQLRAGLYFDFLQDWIGLFPKRQFHILNYSDFVKNQIREMNEVFQFLEIYKLESQKFQETVKELKYSNRERVTPSQRIKDFLDNFYESHNEALSGLLKDSKYLWRAERS